MTGDVRRALRLAAARPGAWTLLVLTLALGIAAPTIALSLADAVLWHPLPFRNADRLVRVRAAVGLDELRHSPAGDRWLANVFPYDLDGATIDAGRGAEAATIGEISPDLFESLGVAPASGRLFAPDEFTTSAPVVIASAALGKELKQTSLDQSAWTVKVDGVSKAVVGVMPEGFDFPVARMMLWQPMASPVSSRTVALGVLRPDIKLSTVTAAADEGWPPDTHVTPFVAPSSAAITAVGAFAGAACLLFVVALANAAGLQLSNAADQRRELGIRTALGATMPQLARAVLVDTACAATVACAVALLITALVLPFIVRAVPYLLAFQTLRPVRVDARALAIAAGASLVAAAIASMISIVRLRRVDPRSTLEAHGAAGGSTSRARRVLAAAAIAVVVPILASAALLANSLARLTDVRPGFRTEGLLQALIELPSWRYQTEVDRRNALAQITEELMTTSGVERVTMAASTPPALDWVGLENFGVENRADAPGAGFVSYDSVDDQFFATLGVTLAAGRNFDGRDVEGSERVVIVSRALAATLWPGGGAIGQRFRSTSSGPWRTIVGVVADLTSSGPDRSRGNLAFYLPAAQTPASQMSTMVIRTRTADASVAMPEVRRAIAAAAPDAPLIDFAPLSDWLTEGFDRERFVAGIVSAIAGAALLLALVGTYAMFRTAVRSRTREIGVRMSLGATPAGVTRAILSESALVAAGGLLVGMPLAFAATRTLSAWLFQVSPADPATLASVALAIVAAAIGAAYAPARRAARVDPAVALRDL